MARRNNTAIAVGFGGLLTLGGLLLWAGRAKAKKVDPKPTPKPVPPADEPEPEQPEQPQPEEPFDLVTNWGGFPATLRAPLGQLELASGIPGIARALAVKWWQAWRAMQPLVDPDTAAQMAAASPELCTHCLNVKDGPASKALLDANIKKGNPAPKDYAGYAIGSGGLGDILGANIAYAGLQTGKTLPFLSLKASEAFARIDVQMTTAASMIRQFLRSEKYPVLVPGPNSAEGDSRETWSRIFAAWAAPSDFAKQGDLAKAAQQRYLDRAAEIGIDLAQVAYPWPPGLSYAVPDWTVQKVWKRLQQALAQGGQKPNKPAQEPSEGLASFVELPAGGRGVVRSQTQEEGAPLVLVFHGRNADETQLMDAVPTDIAARIVFLRGHLPDPQGGRLFFGPRLTDPETKLVPALRDAGNIAAQWIRALQQKYQPARVVALGFSQGAALALQLAALGAVDGVVAFSGGLPPKLRPAGPADVLIRQIHGKADQVVPEVLDRDTAAAFQEAGYLGFYEAIPDQGHKQPTNVRPHLEAALDQSEPGEVGLSLDDCKVTITNLAQVTRTLTRRLLDVARGAVQHTGKMISRDDLIAFVDAFFVDLAPLCALGDKPFADGLSAKRGYWAFRSALRALVFRGLLSRADGISLLTDLAARAKTLGVGALDLPPLDVAG